VTKNFSIYEALQEFSRLNTYPTATDRCNTSVLSMIHCANAALRVGGIRADILDRADVGGATKIQHHEY
jgi:hypothetical protein